MQLLGQRIVLARTTQGLIALEDRCSHRFAPLSKGRCEGANIRCMYHGLLFAPDGTCVEIPGQEVVPPHAGVQSYAIVERGGWVFVWGGNRAEADERLLPPFVPLDSPDYLFVKGALDYQASNSLINANLLDFTHLAYVHTASFGADENWSKVRPDIRAIDNGVRVHWWVERQLLPDLNQDGSAYIDLRTTYDYLVPGFLVMRTEPFPLGTIANLSDTGEPHGEPLVSEVHGQAVTALTEKKSRYFFTWGVPKSLPGAEKIAAQRLSMARAAFAEDKEIIEAQQSVIDSGLPPRQVMPTAADRAIALFERKMAQLKR